MQCVNNAVTYCQEYSRADVPMRLGRFIRNADHV